MTGPVCSGDYESSPDDDGYGDWHDPGVCEQPEPGVDYDPDNDFRSRMQLTEAIDLITAEYEKLLRPYRESMRRNPGVKPVAMARLEASRDEKVRELIRKYEHVRALENAGRQEPQRVVRAVERQQSRAALEAFGKDLAGGSRRYSQQDEFRGRETSSIWVWS